LFAGRLDRVAYEFDIVPQDVSYEWIRSLDPSHLWYPIMPVMLEGETEQLQPDARIAGAFDPRTECQNTLQALEASGIQCPPTDERLAHLCFSYLVDSGFLNAPSAPMAGPGRPATAGRDSRAGTQGGPGGCREAGRTLH
jgi:hypothetical protein